MCVETELFRQCVERDRAIPDAEGQNPSTMTLSHTQAEHLSFERRSQRLGF